MPIEARYPLASSGYPAGTPLDPPILVGLTWSFSDCFFFPSPHIPGKVPVVGARRANVRAPNYFLPERFLGGNFTNRRVPIHRYPGSVYETWTWPFERFLKMDL